MNSYSSSTTRPLQRRVKPSEYLGVQTLPSLSLESVLQCIKSRLTFVDCPVYSDTHNYLSKLSLDEAITSKFTGGVQYVSTNNLSCLESADAVGRSWRKIVNLAGELKKRQLLIVGPTAEWNDKQKQAILCELKTGSKIVVGVGTWPKPTLIGINDEELYKRLEKCEKWWMEVEEDERKRYAVQNMIHWMVHHQQERKAMEIVLDFSWATTRGIRGWEKDIIQVESSLDRLNDRMIDDDAWKKIARAVRESRKLIEKKETLGRWERNGRELAWQLFGRLSTYKNRHREVKILISSIENYDGSLRRKVDRKLNDWD